VQEKIIYKLVKYMILIVRQVI